MVEHNLNLTHKAVWMWTKYCQKLATLSTHKLWSNFKYQNLKTLRRNSVILWSCQQTSDFWWQGQKSMTWEIRCHDFKLKKGVCRSDVRYFWFEFLFCMILSIIAKLELAKNAIGNISKYFLQHGKISFLMAWLEKLSVLIWFKRESST